MSNVTLEDINNHKLRQNFIKRWELKEKWHTDRKLPINTMVSETVMQYIEELELQIKLLENDLLESGERD